jgi:hypothetical protein
LKGVANRVSVTPEHDCQLVDGLACPVARYHCFAFVRLKPSLFLKDARRAPWHARLARSNILKQPIQTLPIVPKRFR